MDRKAPIQGQTLVIAETERVEMLSRLERMLGKRAKVRRPLKKLREEIAQQLGGVPLSRTIIEDR